jgi:hypothetical protein
MRGVYGTDLSRMKIMRPAPVDVQCKQAPSLLSIMMESNVPAQTSDSPTWQKQVTGCAKSSLVQMLGQERIEHRLRHRLDLALFAAFRRP